MYRFFILISFFLYSCTKEGGNISVEGRVYNPLTGEGAEGIEVKLIRDKVGGAPGAQSAGTTAEDISVTDENGLYSLNGVFGREVRYYVDGNKYHSIGVGNNSITGDPTYSGRIGLNPGKHNKVDFWVVPYGNLKLDILNVNCEGEDDKLFYKRFWVTYNQETNGVTRFGCFQFNGNYFQLPIGEYRYEWEVTRNSVTTYHDTTFNILENGFHTVTIHY